MTETTPGVKAVPEGNADEQERLLDLSAPQGNYRDFVAAGTLVCPMEGVALSFPRETTDFILRNHGLFSSHVEMHLGNIRPLIPLNIDPPKHAKYRRLLDPLFAPRRMEEQDANITQRANALIDGFIDAGECNFSEDFAELFPSSVFLGLCGLPEDELRLFLRLRDGCLHPEKIDPMAMFDMDVRRRVMDDNGLEIYGYFGGLVDERRRRPTDDLISRFLETSIDDERLTKDEILDILFLFLIAGLDTVSDSLTCFYAFLATHPDHRGQIVADPSIIPAAVEELLRWESPVPSSVPRVALEDVELPNGELVKGGTAMVVSYGAANVDPSVFPDAFDVRFDRKTNPHIAFGGGVHRCLGSHLARRELRITLKEWHRRIPEYRLKSGHEELTYPPGLRHVKDLTLSWG